MLNNTYLFAIDAEKAILEYIITNKQLCTDIINKNLNSTDFFCNEYEKIYEIIEELANQNDYIDKITIVNLLLKRNVKQKVIDCVKNFDDNNSIKDIKSYIDIIKEKKVVRNLITECRNIINITTENNYKDVDELLNIALNKILSISKTTEKNDFANTSDILTTVIKNIEEMSERSNDELQGIPTSFYDLDNLTSGLNKSDLIVIAGRPSTGKTALAINIAENILINLKKSVVIFSMEMSSEQIVTRMLSSISKISLQKIRKGEINKNDWPRLNSSVELLNDKNLFIDDNGMLTTLDISSKVKKLKKFKKNIGAIIIDYIQLIKSTLTKENRSAELAEISRALKILAKEINVPIIVLSQLNRGVEQRNDRKPVMSDLRESGAIEQDADVIIFLCKNNFNIKNNQVEIIIAKQRNGPIGKFNLIFNPEYCRFENE